MLEERRLLSITSLQITAPNSNPIEGQQIEVDFTVTTTSGQGANVAIYLNGNTQNPINATLAEGVTTPVMLPGQPTGSLEVDALADDAGDPSDSGTSASPLYFNVAEAAISFQPANTANVLEGANSVLLGTLTSQNPLASPSDFSGSGIWNDGSGSSDLISFDYNAAGSNSTQSVFDVYDTHSFDYLGFAGFSASIQDSEGESSYGSVAFNVVPPPPSIDASGMSDTMFANPGVEFSANLADFTDSNPFGQQSDYSASVTWGDGSAIDNGSSIVPDGNGGWFVQGSHYYSSTGVYTVGITINDVDGASASVTSTVQVYIQPGVLNATMSVPTYVQANQDVQAVVFATTTDASGTNWYLDGNQTPTYIPEAQTSTLDLGSFSAGTYSILAHVTDASASTDPGSPYYDSGIDVGPATLNAFNELLSYTPSNPTVTQGDYSTAYILGTLIDKDPNATAGDFNVDVTYNPGLVGLGIVADPADSNASQSAFLVQTAQNQFLTAGQYGYSAILQDQAGDSCYAYGSFVVQGPPVTLDTSQTTYVPLETAADPTVTLGQITDANTSVDPSSLSGIVYWSNGDTGATTFTPVSGQPGVFTVSAMLTADTSVAGTATYTLGVTDNYTGVSASANGTITIGGPLAAPVIDSAQPASPTEVDLSWTTPYAAPMVFDIERSTDGVNFTSIGTTTSDSFADLTATAGMTYIYQIAATADGQSPASSDPVTVATPPVLSVTGDSIAVQGSPYTLNLSALYSTGATNGPVQQWIVDFGDGTDDQIISGNPSSIAYTYLDAFAQTTIQAWAVDSGGQFAAAPLSVEVAASAPTLTVTGNSTVPAGSTYTLNLAAAYQAGGPGITQWTVDFGDGTPGNPDVQTYSGDTTSVTHTFAAGIANPIVNVTAMDANGSYDSDPFPVTVTGVTPPSAPVSFAATAYSANEVDLSWSPGSGGSNSYTILRSADGGNTWQTLATITDGSTSYIDATVNATDTYTYQLTASNDAGGSPAATASVTTPDGVLSLTATPAIRSATLAWTYDGQDDSGFEIEMAEEGIDNFHLIDTAGPGNGTYTVSNLDPGETYDFRIRTDYPDGTVSDYTSTSAKIPEPLLEAGSGTLFDSVTLGGSDSVDGVLTASDTDGDSLTYSASGVQGGTLALDPSNGHFTFTSDGSSQIGYFTFTANDGHLTSNVASEEIVFTGDGYPYPDGASPPLAGYRYDTTPEATTLNEPAQSLWALAYTENSDGTSSPDGMTITQVTDPGNPRASGHQIQVNSDGSFSYSPPAGFVGIDWFSYQATDLVTGWVSNIATDFVTVKAAPANPVTAPTTPANLNAVLTSPNTVQLNWQNTSDNESDFVLERSTSPSFQQDVTAIELPADDTVYSDTLPTTYNRYWYRLQAVNDTGPSPGWTNSVNVIGLTLQSLKYVPQAHDGYEPIRLDWGTYAPFGSYYDELYGGNQWLAGNLTGQNPDPDPTVQSPVAYVCSGTTPSLPTIKVTFLAAMPNGANWLVRAEGTAGAAGLEFSQTKLGSGATAQLTSSDPLPSVILSTELDINWQVSFNNGATWYAAGSTDNHIYITGAKATGDGQYETVMAIGCAAASGANTTTDSQYIIDTIFNQFATLQVTHIAAGQAVGSAMTYWNPQKSGANPHDSVTDWYSVASLLKNSDSRCNAWAKFFLAAARDQGVGGLSLMSIYPKTYTGAVPLIPGLQFTKKVELLVDPHAKAQGNVVPIQHDFDNHEVVLMTRPAPAGSAPGAHTYTLFDPSYGTTPEMGVGTSIDAAVGGQWEQTALAGFDLEYLPTPPRAQGPLPVTLFPVTLPATDAKGNPVYYCKYVPHS